MTIGTGKLLWVAAPVELADNNEPTATFYRLALQTAGITSAIANASPDDLSLLVYPARYRDAVLYTIVSETRREPGRVTFGAPSERPSVSVSVGAGRAALVDRRTGTVIADHPRGSATTSWQP